MKNPRLMSAASDHSIFPPREPNGTRNKTAAAQQAAIPAQEAGAKGRERRVHREAGGGWDSTKQKLSIV